MDKNTQYTIAATLLVGLATVTGPIIYGQISSYYQASSEKTNIANQMLSDIETINPSLQNDATDYFKNFDLTTPEGNDVNIDPAKHIII